MPGRRKKHLSRPDELNVAMFVAQTEVEGPGHRYALWVQGCPMRCPGCCNPHLLEFKEEAWSPTPVVADQIIQTPDIEGVTFLGGEPFSQAEALADVARRVRAAGLSVMIFSGFLREHLERGTIPGALALLDACDILVDGPFVEAEASRSRRYIGSDNQRVHILTERYAQLAGDRWPKGGDGVEIRWRGDQLSINGYPHPEILKLIENGLKFAGSSGDAE